MQYKFSITSQSDTRTIAENIAGHLQIGDILALRGNLGTGKTTFCRFLIQYLSERHTEVVSPTFNLVQPYDTDKFTIYHFDLYRVESANDVYEIGLEDALNNGVSLIEWPEIIDTVLPADTIWINIAYDNKCKDCRKINIESKSRNLDFLENLRL